MGKRIIAGLAMLYSFTLLAQDPHPIAPGDAPSTASLSSATAALTPLTFGKRVQICLMNTFGPGEIANAAFSAAVDQWRDEPPEWKQGAEGYGRRAGSWFGSAVVKNTIAFGLSSLDGEDIRYHPSGKHGFWKRSFASAYETFFPNTTRGGRTFAFSRVGAALSAGLISNTWYPDRLSNTEDGLLRGVITLGGDLGNNAFHEFWPDVRKKVLHRKRNSD